MKYNVTDNYECMPAHWSTMSQIIMNICQLIEVLCHR